MVQETRRPLAGNVYIRILGRQLERFIEFEFILNDEDLAVELVMPEPAFKEFCDYYEATILPSEAAIEEGEHRLAGLYQAPDA